MMFDEMYKRSEQAVAAVAAVAGGRSLFEVTVAAGVASD